MRILRNTCLALVALLLCVGLTVCEKTDPIDGGNIVFEAVNDDGVTIYYEINADGTTVAVANSPDPHIIIIQNE